MPKENYALYESTGFSSLGLFLAPNKSQRVNFLNILLLGKNVLIQKKLDLEY